MEAAETFPNATPISDDVLDDAFAAATAENNNAAGVADNPTESYTPALILRGCEVIPRPGDAGIVVAVDRREIIMPNAAAFAAKMNQKIPKIRVDMDHRTEPGSYDYKPNGAPIGTRADGWANNFREQNGALVCDLDISVTAPKCAAGRPLPVADRQF